MSWESYADREVHRHYWDHNDTCAHTTLSILSVLFALPLDPQVLDAALGMWGAGGQQAQCGLVEGALMFTGIVGRRRGLNRDQISDLAKRYALEFQSKFGSLICRQLRPQGFAEDNPPHLCEDLSKRAVRFAARFIAEALQLEPAAPPADGKNPV